MKNKLIFSIVAIATIMMIQVSCITPGLTSGKFIRAFVDGTLYEWTSLINNPDSTFDDTFTGPYSKFYLSEDFRQIIGHRLNAAPSDPDTPADMATFTARIGYDSTSDSDLTIDSLDLISILMGVRFTATDLVYGADYSETTADEPGGVYTFSTTKDQDV